MEECGITMQPTRTMSPVDAIAVFVKVVEAGSFSAAARRLGIPKTTVSAKVAGLEKRLGIRLMQRTTRKLRMTEAGERYFSHCAIATREIELGEAALQLARGEPYGVLKVTAPVDLGHAVLPRIVRAYAARYPNVSVELIVTNRVVDVLEEGHRPGHSLGWRTQGFFAGCATFHGDTLEPLGFA